VHTDVGNVINVIFEVGIEIEDMCTLRECEECNPWRLCAEKREIFVVQEL
jgi:hypothetical protein